MKSAKRQRAYRRGRSAERIAVWWLRLKRYRILGCGIRNAFGEIDIIARRGNLLVYVEVKARSDRHTGLEALSVGQRRRIDRAAAAWQATRPELAALDQRFDLVVVAPGRWPHHIQDAWRLDQQDIV